MTEIAKGTVAASKEGTVSAFQDESVARGKALGYKVSKKGQTFTFTHANGTVIVVGHSEKGYVRTVTVNGKALWEDPKKAPKKHKTLQDTLVSHAN